MEEVHGSVHVDGARRHRRASALGRRPDRSPSPARSRRGLPKLTRPSSRDSVMRATYLILGHGSGRRKAAAYIGPRMSHEGLHEPAELLGDGTQEPAPGADLADRGAGGDRLVPAARGRLHGPGAEGGAAAQPQRRGRARDDDAGMAAAERRDLRQVHAALSVQGRGHHRDRGSGGAAEQERRGGGRRRSRRPRSKSDGSLGIRSLRGP